MPRLPHPNPSPEGEGLERRSSMPARHRLSGDLIVSDPLHMKRAMSRPGNYAPGANGQMFARRADASTVSPKPREPYSNSGYRLRKQLTLEGQRSFNLS